MMTKSLIKCGYPFSPIICHHAYSNRNHVMPPCWKVIHSTCLLSNRNRRNLWQLVFCCLCNKALSSRSFHHRMHQQGKNLKLSRFCSDGGGALRGQAAIIVRGKQFLCKIHKLCVAYFWNDCDYSCGRRLY